MAVSRWCILVITLTLHSLVANAGPVSIYASVSPFGRNIRPIACKAKTGEEGVCMFAMDCTRMNGHHLGTCIDRFYFGSCCSTGPSMVTTPGVTFPFINSNEIALLTSPTPSPSPATTFFRPEVTEHPNILNELSSTLLPGSTSTTGPVTTAAAAPSETTLVNLLLNQLASTSTTLGPSSSFLPSATPTTTVASTTIGSSSPGSTTVESTTAEPTTPITTTTTTATTSTTEPSTTIASTTTTTTAEPPPSSTTTTTTPSSSSPVTVAVELTAPSTYEPTVDEVAVTSETPIAETTFLETEAVTLVPDTESPEDLMTLSWTTESSEEFVTESATENIEFTTLQADAEKGVSTTTTEAPSSASTAPGASSSLPSTAVVANGTDEPVKLPEELTTTTTTVVPVMTSESTSVATASSSSNATLTVSSTEAGPSTTPWAVESETTSDGATVQFQDYHQVCGRPKYHYPSARIVGGTTTHYGQWPWQISLRQWRTATFLHKCGAALLNENWAITAAHCVDSVQPDDLLLRMGEYDLATDEEEYPYIERKVQIVASHPQFDARTFEYDLALLRFYDPVRFQPNIIPICLPQVQPEVNLVGRTAYVTGWGRLYEDGPLPSKMQQVSVPIINNTECENMYRKAGYVEHIPNIFICAGYAEGKRDSCEGDSGGPLVVQNDGVWSLVGVISWGIGCAEANQPGVYTRITEFREWIDKIIVF